MTLNQTVNRIKTIALAHKQVRSFYYGLVSDFLTDQRTKYPAVFLQDNGGKISTDGHATTLSYRLFLMDLVHVSEETKLNEVDAQSDMVSIAMDLIAEFNAGNFNDWALSTDNNLQLVVENDNDLHAGCIVDISIRIMFKQNLCEVPSDLFNYPTGGSASVFPGTDLKSVFDEKYVATGAEGTSLIIAALNGKKVLFITRETNLIYKVSSAPDPAEYTWDNVEIKLGTVTNKGERFLILYRNY